MSAFKKYFLQTLFKRYASFSGRASRAEFWYFVLFYCIIFLLLLMVALLFMKNPVASKIAIGALLLYGLFILIPTIAITVRRFHDSGKSGWWYLLFFLIGATCALIVDPKVVNFGGKGVKYVAYIISLAVSFIPLWWECLSGDRDANKYGDPPTYDED